MTSKEIEAIVKSVSSEVMVDVKRTSVDPKSSVQLFDPYSLNTSQFGNVKIFVVIKNTDFYTKEQFENVSIEQIAEKATRGINYFVFVSEEQ